MRLAYRSHLLLIWAVAARATPPEHRASHAPTEERLRQRCSGSRRGPAARLTARIAGIRVQGLATTGSPSRRVFPGAAHSERRRLGWIRCYIHTRMLDLYRELRRIVETLDAAGIAYALAGGLAVSIYTAPRATEDIDILIARADLDRAVGALQPTGFRPAGRPMPVAGGRLEIQRLTKIDGADLLPLDLLMAVDPTLAALLTDRVSLALEGRPVWVVGLGALRTLKQLRGSALDRADLEALGPEER